MPGQESYPTEDSDDYGDYIARLRSQKRIEIDSDSETERLRERWKQSQTDRPDYPSTLSPTYVHHRNVDRVVLNPGLLDADGLDDNPATEAPIAPIEDR